MHQRAGRSDGRQQEAGDIDRSYGEGTKKASPSSSWVASCSLWGSGSGGGSGRLIGCWVGRRRRRRRRMK